MTTLNEVFTMDLGSLSVGSPTSVDWSAVVKEISFTPVKRPMERVLAMGQTSYLHEKTVTDFCEGTATFTAKSVREIHELGSPTPTIDRTRKHVIYAMWDANGSVFRVNMASSIFTDVSIPSIDREGYATVTATWECEPKHMWTSLEKP